ncbi:MAG: zinc ABC transporter substrate-binding protein [Deltaproteobacteria bacterium]|nr:zinc ABC transporter substrate-binding protein [Deltaproteobacteria bacterium]TLN04048.1 MAG: zinc ABC transporter substrate-binding protein [bacterium]
MKRILFIFLILLAAAAPATAAVNVVTTLPWIGSLAREIGGRGVSVTVLVKSHQDPHYVEAKPSMILAARSADIIMYNGLDLEIGYLPLILESSRNPKIMPGKPGNFDCSRFVTVTERPVAVDRSLGDVHPLGNPHYYFSPANVLRVAEGMAGRFTEIDGANAGRYRENLRKFVEQMKEKRKSWASLPLKGKKFVSYHKLFEYLAVEYGFGIVGYLEPKPGIPPSAAYVKGLLETVKREAPDGILATLHYGRKESEAFGMRSGLKVIILPSDVGSMPATDTWFDFMDKTLSALR